MLPFARSLLRNRRDGRRVWHTKRVAHLAHESNARVSLRNVGSADGRPARRPETASLGRSIPRRTSPDARYYMVGKPAGRGPAARVKRTTSGATTEQLLERYRQRGSNAQRGSSQRGGARGSHSCEVLDEIVERHRGTVESMALAFCTRLPRSVDVQDLIHAGMWGLMQAISAYEPERSASFDAFLRIRVRGAMLDELRHMDFLPRLFRRRVRERDAARARRASGCPLHRSPRGAQLSSVHQEHRL